MWKYHHFVDDMCIDIIDWDGSRNMQRVEADIKRIVREVAEESNMQIEKDKGDIEREMQTENTFNGWE